MNYIDQQKMKQVNAAHILHLIRENEGLTRRQLEAISNMSWGAISKITSILIDDGYVLEEKKEAQGLGRTPTGLFLNPNEHFSVGMDINRSGMRAVLVNLKNEIIKSFFEPVGSVSYPEFLEDIKQLAVRTANAAQGKNILGVGIAMQGEVDSQNGISLRFPECEGWRDIPLAKILSDTLGAPAFIEHDPNCLMYAYAAQNGFEDALLIRADKGIGMAMMTDGRIFDRAGSLEIAHLAVSTNDSGAVGRLEDYASQTGLENIANKKFDEIAALAKSGSRSEKELFYKTADRLAFSVANCCTLMNISKVVLCGDMIDHKELFLEDFSRLCEKYSFSSKKLSFTFTDVRNAAYGAALISASKMIDKIY